MFRPSLTHPNGEAGMAQPDGDRREVAGLLNTRAITMSGITVFCGRRFADALRHAGRERFTVAARYVSCPTRVGVREETDRGAAWPR
jgi:hypothetical protein